MIFVDVSIAYHFIALRIFRAGFVTELRCNRASPEFGGFHPSTIQS